MNTPKTTLVIPASLKKYAHMIDSIEDYRSQGKGGDGYWVHLVRGWICTSTETHSVHEDNIGQCVQVFRDFVESCACNECKKR